MTSADPLQQRCYWGPIIIKLPWHTMEESDHMLSLSPQPLSTLLLC